MIKKYKRQFFFLVLFLLITFIISARGKKLSGVVGQIQLEITNEYFGKKPGIIDEKLTVVIRNLDTEREYKGKTDKNEYFQILNLPAGHYVLSKLYTEMSDGSSTKFYIGGLSLLRKEYAFIITENSIYNLNHILAKFQYKEVGNTFYYGFLENIDAKEKNDDILFFFKNKNKNKYWLNCKWKSIDYINNDFALDEFTFIRNKVIFTNQTDAKASQSENLKVFKVNEKVPICAFIKWKNLNVGNTSFKAEWVGPDGNIFKQESVEFNLYWPEWNTWFYYYFKRDEVPLGDITLKLYLNDRFFSKHKIKFE